MSLLFETIKLENGQLHLLDYHQKRCNASRKELFGNEIAEIDLAKSIEIPANLGNGLFRCRISYGEKIEKLEFFPYQLRHPKSIKLVEANEVDYHLKYENREKLNHLVLESKADEIIITQHGFLTDTSYSNIALFDGKKWFTPSTFLLDGCKRQFLLDENLIEEKEISVANLFQFKRLAFINAMRDFEAIYDLSLLC